jgi:hypothetical protein
MKRWHLWSAALVALILFALSAAAIRNGRKKQAQNKREVAYQSVLNSYSAALKPGLARQEVHIDGNGVYQDPARRSQSLPVYSSPILCLVDEDALIAMELAAARSATELGRV